MKQSMKDSAKLNAEKRKSNKRHSAIYAARLKLNKAEEALKKAEEKYLKVKERYDNARYEYDNLSRPSFKPSTENP